jgi:hypothetical protein
MKAVRNFLAEKAFFAIKRDAGPKQREVGDCEKDLDRRIEDLRPQRGVSGFTFTMAPHSGTNKRPPAVAALKERSFIHTATATVLSEISEEDASASHMGFG